ncbi:hypothetical protein RI129_004025 [Pyrocoelia pectoralis]|uniref:Uncharacterized protein n=1 Tax=Pyrocoelia pectoralis TaxID=417401 RepID=A0AAN7ZVR3_9COLE
MDRQKSDIFSLDKSLNSGTDILSVGGTRYGKLNRIRSTSSNVFPIGCMGTTESPRDDGSCLISDRGICLESYRGNDPVEKPSPIPETAIGDVTSPREVKLKRNPLTGEGIESTDMPKLNPPKKQLEKTKFNY